MAIDLNKLLEAVNTEVRESTDGDANLRFELTTVVAEFKRKFRDIEINEYRDIFNLCESIDEVGLEVPENLKRTVLGIRRRVKEILLQEIFREELGDCGFDAKRSQEVTHELELAKVAARLIPRLIMIDPGEFDQTFIEYNFEDDYKQLCRLLKDEDTKLVKWEDFRNLLPDGLKDHFKISHKPSSKFDLKLEDIKPYEHIAKKLGPEAVAELLVASGRIKKADYQKAVSFISNALGRCKREPVVPSDLGKGDDKIPDALLHKKGVDKTVFRNLRDYIYQQLLQGAKDVSTNVAEIRFESEKRKIEAILDDILDDEEYELHAEILKNLLKYYKEVFTLEVPKNIVESLSKGDEEVFDFPSLRQRIAMVEMRKKRRQLIAFFMGQGKTAAAFLSKEYVGAKRMLYVCPPGELEDEVKEKVEEYYKEGQKPTVGIIRGFKITPKQRKAIKAKIQKRKSIQKLSKAKKREEFNKQFKIEIAKLREQAFYDALSADIVILPYSMFSSNIGGKKVVDWVCEEDFDFMTVDEVHHARKDDTKRNTRVVYKLATGIKGLYEEGHIALLSADPMPNGPDDLAPQFRIWNNKLYKNVSTLRAAAKKHVHPLFMKNEISEFLLLIDPEEDWQRHEVPVEFELGLDERIIYNSILWDEDIPANIKMQLLYLCVLNPSLFTTRDDVDSSLFNQCVDLTQKSFDEGFNSVVIVENMLKQGITRKHDERGGISILDKLREQFGEDVEIEFLDGSVTSKDERKKITRLMKTKSNQKRIFLVNGNIIREGINLSAISRCIMLDPTFNKADTVQLLKRFAREGNDEAKMYSLCAMGTIMEAIRKHADAKYLRTQIVKYGGSLTDDDYALLEEEIFDCKLKLDDEYVLISSFIKDHTLTERQKMVIVMSQLFTDRKVEGVEDLLEKFGLYIAERYMLDWESSTSGNNSRLVTGLIKDLEEAGVITGNRFLDVACGPLILRNTLGQMDDGKDRIIHSLDINSHMIDIGKTVLKEKDPKAKPKVQVGKMNDLSAYPDGHFDVLNNSLAFDYTKLSKRITKHTQNDQRVQTLCEYNRVLKEGGIAIITLHNRVVPTETFFQTLEDHFGFEVLEDYTGQGVSTDKKEINTFRNNTIVLRKVGEPKNIQDLNLEDLVLHRISGSSGAVIREMQQEKPKQMPERCNHNEFVIKRFKFTYPSQAQEEDEASKPAPVLAFPRSEEEQVAEEKKEIDVRDRNDSVRDEIKKVQDKYKGAFPVKEQVRLENELKIQFSYADSKIPIWFRYTDVKCKPDEVQWYSIV